MADRQPDKRDRDYIRVHGRSAQAARQPSATGATGYKPSDAHKPYLGAVVSFRRIRGLCDAGQIYGTTETGYSAHRRYSLGTVNGTERIVVSGSCDLSLISTSYAERNNLTMRRSMRRLTGLTNAVSTKLENHAAQVALHFWYNNFCRKHQTLKTTPAVTAGMPSYPM